LGATAPPKTQHVGEAHTALDRSGLLSALRKNQHVRFLCPSTAPILDIAITGESWLAEEEEVVHAQIVDAEPDLTWHLEDSAIADAHVQLVSAEPDPWLGKPDSLEDDTRAHLVSTEPEILMNAEEDWLQEVEEEETDEVTAAVDNTHIDLQRLGVSKLTMLKGKCILTFPLSQSPHQHILSRTEHPPRSPATEAGTQATKESRCWTSLAPPPLDLPLPNGEAEPPGNAVPEQIQAPTPVERRLESLRGKRKWRVTGQSSQTSARTLKGKETWRATGQDSQKLVRTLEGMAPLGVAHGRPPDPTDPYARGSTVLEQKPIDPKAQVRISQMRRPVVDEGAGAHIDPWPDPGSIHPDLDVYFEMSALLEGEQKHILPSLDSEQVVTLKIFSFSSLLLPPTALERDLKGEDIEREQRDAVQRPVRRMPPSQVAEDPDEAGGVWLESAPAILVCPQLATGLEMGDVEAPNPGMVEAKRKAEWPARGQATEHECRPGQSPREAPYRRNQKVLRSAGTCKPKDECHEQAMLKSAAPGHLEGKPRHMEEGLAWEGIAEPQGAPCKATEPRARTSLSAEKEDTCTDKNRVNMARIAYNDAHTPSFPFPVTLGHSCSRERHG
jgi:hypothetical protein